MEFFQLFPLPVPYLGVTLTIAVVSTALFVGALALSFFATPQANSSLQPTSLDEFGITLTKEGTPVPLLYGINRVPGNIIFYGNLSTKEVFAKAGGGKGSGGSEKQLVGYEYRLDVWQTIGLGKLELVDTYVNDEIKTVDAADIVFDDGTQNTFPDFGQKTRQLEGISHIAFTQFFLGENSQSLPTVHYVVKRILDTGLTNQNMTHGNNPAAVIYDLFQRRGLVVTEFDFTSFENADTYFFNRDIAISMIIDQLTDTKDIVNRIMKVIPIVVYVDNLDRIAVRVLDENDSADWTLVDGDHKDLQIDIQTYSLLDNDFTAKYKDMDQDFSERVVAADNPAVESLAGRRKTRGLDFTIIRKSETASNMVFDQMKKLTFPRKRLTFVSNLKLIDAIPGQVIDFSDTDLAISNLFLRIDKITKPAIGGQDIRVEATEMIEKLFNTEFAILNFSSPSGIGEILPNVVADDIFEFPYTEDEQFTQNIVAIMERTFGVETAFDVAFSPTRDLPVEFQFKQRLTSYSQTGTLDEDYNFTNFIDDSEDGLIYSPNVTFYPEFDPIEFIRSLSQFDRFLLIGKQGHSEIMTFGQIEPEGVASFKIKNIQRGMFGSRVKKTYPAGTTISLFNVLNNFLNFQISNGSILQFQGVFNNKLEVPPLDTLDTNNDRHSTMLGLPCVVEVTKTGTSYSVKTYPTNNEAGGFGEGTPDDSTFEGDSERALPSDTVYEVYFNDNRTINFSTETTVDFVVTAPSAGQNILNIELRQETPEEVNESQIAKMTVPSSDGVHTFNFVSKWSRKVYNASDVWLKDFIEPMETL